MRQRASLEVEAIKAVVADGTALIEATEHFTESTKSDLDGSITYFPSFSILSRHATPEAKRRAFNAGFTQCVGRVGLAGVAVAEYLHDPKNERFEPFRFGSDMIVSCR